MLVREGDERNDTIDLGLACSLAAIAGALNAAAFYAVGFFSANMTGNVSTLSDHIALGQWRTGLFYVSILLAFVVGAACSALLISAGRRRGMRRIYAYGIAAEAILLTGLGCADLWRSGEGGAAVIVLGLAFVMGFQNAVGTRISGARVRTTHVSGLATDIGIELAVAIDTLRGRAAGGEEARNLGRLRLHLSTVLSFLTGGVVGVVLYRLVGGFLLILAAAVLLAIAGSGVAQARRSAHRAPAIEVP